MGVAEEISKSYGPKVLFEHIGFNINEGDKIALIAPNGTGKSTLLRILAGNDKSDSGGKITFLKHIRIAFLEQEFAHDPEKDIFTQVMDSSKKFTEGLDVIDTAIEPLSWGKVHPDIISVQSMLKNAGFDVPEINMEAYMEARKLTQEFIDDFLGYFMNPSNKLMSSLLLGCGLPGGMMGSMMADLTGVMSAINSNREKQGKEPLSEDALLVRLFDEVAYVWPRVGYPPLVTPFSQYVKNIALMNLLTDSMGKPRYTMMDNSIWGMILGKSGKLPGEVAPEIIELAKEKGFEFTDADPQSYYPDELPRFIKEMEENGWERGEDDEELFEFAMHETQYRDYKSGAAKKRFLADLQAARDKETASGMSLEEAAAFKHAKADAIVATESGTVLWEIGGDGECVKSIEPFIGKEYKESDAWQLQGNRI